MPKMTAPAAREDIEGKVQDNKKYTRKEGKV